MTSSDLIRKLLDAGWVQVRVNGSHHHFKHPDHTNLITVAHPKKDIPKGTLRSILKKAKLE